MIEIRKAFMVVMGIAWFINYCFTGENSDIIISNVWIAGSLL
jgi:hypothetical protein